MRKLTQWQMAALLTVAEEAYSTGTHTSETLRVAIHKLQDGIAAVKEKRHARAASLVNKDARVGERPPRS